MSDNTGQGGRWAKDPSGRFELRYWNGQAWTEHVSTNGQQSIDPPTAPPPPPQPPTPPAPPMPMPSSVPPPSSGAIVPPPFPAQPPAPPVYQAAPPYAYGASGSAEGPPEGPPLIGYTKRVLSKYAEFSGRASRAEYWWFFLANLIVSVVLFILVRVAGVFAVLYVLWLLGMIIPSLAVAIRRLHDTNKSGWYLLLGLIPLVGPIISIVFMATSGDQGANQYGPPPA